ncbi:MAG: UvrD-helicase domain-containing protein [Bacteroidota bacterium]|jgi:DNA helicase-2/ATP-dependent DNA helicase PcrA
MAFDWNFGEEWQRKSKGKLPGKKNKADASAADDPLDDLLGSLEQFTDHQAWELPAAEPLDLQSIQYPPVPVRNETREKIEYLKQVITDLEHRTARVQWQSAFDPARKYKVNYREELNEPQFKAATTTEGPLLAIAGAGSGKTRIIVFRLLFLIESGIPPSDILLLTFTRKAAKEMKSRAQSLLAGQNVGQVMGGTFHSFAAYTLRKHANLLGLPHNFTIIDTTDAQDIIDLIRSELKLGKGDKSFPKKRRIQEIISASRNRDVPIKEIIEREYTGLEEYVEPMELIARGFERYKRGSNVFDFDDLMDALRAALQQHSAFRHYMQQSYQYIMVDEFQDTNVVQKDIVNLLAGGHHNLMVVGDDAQSIYAFRGANYENILRFPETYPDCKIVKVEQNYRSVQPLLNFTNNIIARAQLGYRKQLFSSRESTQRPSLHRFYSQEDEAAFIVDRIVELIDLDVPLDELAVLNRADWHNRFIQAELNRRGIPYVVVGGFKFNERKHVKDVVSLLKLVYNPMDAAAWHRVLKLIPGIGRVTASKLVQYVHENKGKLGFAVFSKRKFTEELQKLEKVLIQASKPGMRLDERIEKLRKFYDPVLESREDDAPVRLMDLDVLEEMAKKYKKLDQFLSDFALDPPAKNLAGESAPLVDEREEKGKVTLTTVHSAKGLEWHTVFVPHALDGLFPSNRAIDLEELEEERRLFYVACSRAKELLYITFPSYIQSYDATFVHPSRFLAEVDEANYEILDDDA